VVFLAAFRAEELVPEDLEESLEGWKRVAVWGSIAAGGVLLLTGRRTAGLVLAGAGLAALAAESPEKFEEVWERGPHYVKHATRLMSMMGVLGDYFADRSRRVHRREWTALLEE
jgi:hypothetical protein